MEVRLTEDLVAPFVRRPLMQPWFAELPRLIPDVLREWHLRPDGEMIAGRSAVVVPVFTDTGEAAALKFGWPHPDAAHEHLALRAWAGRGAVRLLRADPHRQVLLLERREERDLCSLQVVDACEVVAGLYAQLHRPPLPQTDRLSTLADRWSREMLQLRGSNLVPRRFVDQASSLARTFAEDPGTDQALVHTDLHYANVLGGSREPWLAVSPKPLSGDPAYEVAPLLWSRWPEAVATGNIRGAVLERLFTVVDCAGLDEDRVRNWVTVRAVLKVWGSVQNGWPGDDAAPTTMATTILKAVQR